MADQLPNTLRNAALTVIVIASFGFSVLAGIQATETEIKAAHLYNFTTFIDWTAAAPTSEPFRLCVVNDDGLKRAIEQTTEGESAGSYVPVLFIGRAEPDRGAKFLTATADLPVLTVGDASPPPLTGVYVEFVLEGDRLGFDRVTTSSARWFDSLNGILDRIENRETELSKANEELRHEVAERRRAEQERAALLVREREAHRLKDEFLATLSHELRTPLSAYAAAPDRERAMAAGFHHHIAKPIDPDLLVQALHRLLTGRPAAAS